MNQYWDKIHSNYTSYYDNWLDNYLNIFSKDDIILELGCGRGYNCEFLYKNGYTNIIATDISSKALSIINDNLPEIKTQLLDITAPLPFKSNSIKIIIADLCLHYFDKNTTNKIFDELHRILQKDGYIIARVNSTNDKYYIPQNAQIIEDNYMFDGKIYKRFFQQNDFDELFKNFKIIKLEEVEIKKYNYPKIIWDFCIQNTLQ